ncbi:two component transcriptional regulator AraC family [Clostridium sp. CAG:269]|nr:two component transcriptional regulator AraC family [Clostridium sp. CAG:269]
MKTKQEVQKIIMLYIGKANIIIADDEVRTCEQIESMLKGYSYINIIGIANTDEEEIKLIEELKPDVVVTDLMRNHEFTGLDIIKEYAEKEISPKFVVVSFSPNYSLCHRYKNITNCIHKFPEINGSELAYKILCAKRIIWKEEQDRLILKEERQHFLERVTKIIV